MIRGTTPTHVFNISFDTSLISDLRITYAQCGKELVVKKYDDVILSDQAITVTLTQEDTLKFDCSKQAVQIELRVKTNGGKVISSGIFNKSVEACLNEEVL